MPTALLYNLETCPEVWAIRVASASHLQWQIRRQSSTTRVSHSVLSFSPMNPPFFLPCNSIFYSSLVIPPNHLCILYYQQRTFYACLYIQHCRPQHQVTGYKFCNDPPIPVAVRALLWQWGWGEIIHRFGGSIFGTGSASAPVWMDETPSLQ
jgi:hypothetical protein